MELKTVPVQVGARVCGFAPYVFESSMPVGMIDRGTSDPADWTTRQIGGDEVYRSAGSGKVYDQYSEPVGHADLQGVYADPNRRGIYRAPWDHSHRLPRDCME